MNPQRPRVAGLRLLVAALSLSALVACSSTDKPKPAALESLPAAATSQRPVWAQRIGGVDFPLRVLVAGDAVVAAGGDGAVQAFDLATGRVLWAATLRSRLSAGVGSDGRFAAVVTQDNVLLVLDQGKELWRANLGSRVTTPPLVAGERVFVQGLDRAVRAFDALDGRRLWVFQRPGDPLALNQQGVLQPVGNVLWVGMGPRLVALDPTSGTVRNEIVVGNPRGGNEVERLADLVGPASRDGTTVCVRAFQTAVGCARLMGSTPTLLWSRPNSGGQGVSLGTDFVLAADASDRVYAWRRGSGELAWRSDRFLYRQLGAPVALPAGVAFGDADGYVHLLAPEDGRVLRRLATDSSGLAAPLVAAGNWLLAVSRSGELSAFRVD